MIALSVLSYPKLSQFVTLPSHQTAAKQPNILLLFYCSVDVQVFSGTAVSEIRVSQNLARLSGGGL